MRTRRLLYSALLLAFLFLAWISTTRKPQFIIPHDLNFTALHQPQKVGVDETLYHQYDAEEDTQKQAIDKEREDKIISHYVTYLFENYSNLTTPLLSNSTDWRAVLSMFNNPPKSFANMTECVEFHREKQKEFLQIPIKSLHLVVYNTTAMRLTGHNRFKLLADKKNRAIAELARMDSHSRREYVLDLMTIRNCRAEGFNLQRISTNPPYTKPFIFVHLPKTGGTTLGELANINEGSRIRFVQIWLHPDPDQIALISKKSTVFGHIYYGLHFYMPEPQKVTYITFLRDPVERIISLYRYHKQQNERLAKTYPLTEWLYKDPDFCNQMTKHLSGIKNYNRSQEMYVLAKHHLIHHFRFVGLTEFYNESLVLMKILLNFNKIEYVLKNPSCGTEVVPRTNRNCWSPEVRERVRRIQKKVQNENRSSEDSKK
eukprot:TRINITY_DN4638_c0_g1_i2.p1 TRINITY_DN4638_c0_g1~~TRINITY_DN4638_c0_g1_i2.p1  ORF type:complete len:429 (-),score=57.92 TRINITY_DN4638_c0_g1_i2:223-1509(-)